MWDKKMMGIIDSTFHVCQSVTWDKYIAMGDKFNPNNLFAWDKVVLKFTGKKNMIVTVHRCLRKGLMGCWMRTYSFTWMMGGQLDLLRSCAGKPPEGGARRVPGWEYRMPPESSNLHHRRRGHILVPLPILKEVLMGWFLKRGGIRLGGYNSGAGGNGKVMEVGDV